MSIDYFLHSKNIYKQIEFNLKEIVELYKEFIEITDAKEEGVIKYKKEYDIQLLKRTKKEYEEKIKELSFLKEFINEKIMNNCSHNFVKDSIDISPDLSQEIEYCTFCELSKK